MNLRCAVLISLMLVHCPAVAAPIRDSCELHIWPEPYYYTLQYGIFNGPAAMNVSKKNAKAATEEFRLTVSGDDLYQAITEIDLKTLFRANTVSTFKHNTDAVTKVSRKAKRRATASTAECYFEIYVDMLWFESSPLGYDLTPYYHLRNFSLGPKPKVNDWYNNEGIKNVPKQTDREWWRTSLTDAFKKSFSRYITKNLK